MVFVLRRSVELTAATIAKGRDVVRPESSIPHPLADLTQLGAIGLDNEVDQAKRAVALELVAMRRHVAPRGFQFARRYRSKGWQSPTGTGREYGSG